MANDEELITAGLSVLEDLAALMMEGAHETAIHTAPADPVRRLARVQDLRRTGADLVVIADACEVLIRRGGTARPSIEDGTNTSP